MDVLGDLIEDDEREVLVVLIGLLPDEREEIRLEGEGELEDEGEDHLHERLHRGQVRLQLLGVEQLEHEHRRREHQLLGQSVPDDELLQRRQELLQKLQQHHRAGDVLLLKYLSI